MNMLTFSQWKELVATNPSQAADHFFSSLEEVDPTTKKAALLQIPDRSSIEAQFEEASRYLDNPLAGIPYFLKDLFDVKDQPTLAGSTFLSTVRKTPEDSCFLQKTLQAHKGIYCGKTQLNEFAYGLSGENPHFGDCPHPVVPHSLSGGSSSGSAWAVGKGLTPLAFGTDTGGSIRVPSAFCGILGMRIPNKDYSTQGVFPLSPSFDTAGWFTQTPSDMQIVNTALIDPFPTTDERPLKYLYFRGYADPTARGLGRGYDQIAQTLGAEIDPETTAWLSHSLNGCQPAYTILQSKEAYEVHRPWFDSMKPHYDPVVWDRIDAGRKWSAFEVEKAQAKREEVKNALADIFTQYDALLIPATPAPSPSKEKLTTEFRQNLLRLTAPASIANLPVLTLPVPLANRLSGGMQVIFPSLEKANTVEILERSLGYYNS